MPFPVDIHWITRTEGKLGVRFPAAFVVAMARSNGGTVQTGTDHFFELFPFFDASDRKRIQRTCGSIDRETENARKTRPGFPAEGVAIGDDMSGNLLILLPMADHPDSLQHTIYWWDRESDEVEAVADDFGDLARR